MSAIVIGVLVIIGFIGLFLVGVTLGRGVEREEQEKAELMQRIDRLEQKVFGEDSEPEENEEKAE